MNTATTLTAYAAVLAVVFGGAVGIGNAVGPVGVAGSSAAQEADSTTGSAAVPAGGLAVSQDGYRLDLLQAPTAAGRTGDLSFRIHGPDGAALTQYTPKHEKDLHLVVVRRDATGFQHLHPQRAADGTWTTPLSLPQAGTYKVLTDFVPAGDDDGLALSTDITVDGELRAVAAPPVEQRTAIVDGYTVTLRGDLVPGRTSQVTLDVREDGRPVEDLEPYLGAYGHLVALRDGDLAYLHVHPEGAEPDGPTGGPALTFAADVPSSGVYRLFLDFQHDGAVHTAALSLPTSDTRGRDTTDGPLEADVHDDADAGSDGHSHG